MIIRDPLLWPVPLKSLRPTQMTVGLREVHEKRRAFRERRKRKKRGFLGHHAIPVVLGASGRHYIIDHHHLARALFDEGVTEALVVVVSDLSRLSGRTFWTFLDHHGWVYPYDGSGRRRDYKDLPRTVEDLADDPYRSLAGELRRAGGFAKDTTPFSEFLWADFLRSRVGRGAIADDFPKALAKALKLARSAEADYLPGWCGPVT